MPSVGIYLTCNFLSFFSRKGSLAQKAGIERWERGQNDGGENREVEPETEDCNSTGRSKQGNSGENQKKRRLEISRDGHDALAARRLDAAPLKLFNGESYRLGKDMRDSNDSRFCFHDNSGVLSARCMRS